MFDLLKKKIGGFIDNLTKKEEKKLPEEKPEKPPLEEVRAPVEEKPEAPPELMPPVKEEKPSEEEPAVKEEKPPEVKPPEEKPPAVKPPEKKKPAAKPPEVKPKAVPKEIEVKPPKVKVPEKPPKVELPPKKEPPKPKEKPPAKAPPKEKPKERIKLGAISAIKGFVTREVEITESDVGGLLDNLELELLEADVDLSVAEAIKKDLTDRLVGSKIKKDQLHNFVSSSIKETLVDTITNDKTFDIVERVESLEKPVKIMFLGVTGSGKTTTIAKVAKLLLENDRKVVFAAADTFRAAAIEQVEVHATRLGVKVIKRDYGSDPTSVAYDAVNYAKAHGIDAVLIDTAGRQDTNISLINEMKKMNRVIKPDITVYIGESIAGNAIIEQISSFNREIGIDAVILTKMDCDPKGGTMLSINKATGIPIIYVGVGQAYEDLEPFQPQKIVDRIVE
jgi:fused signal recognition particle receptor